MAFDFGDLAGLGINAASGNYIGAAVSAVGLGMSIFGGSEQADIAERQSSLARSQADVAHRQAGASMDIATQEMGINTQKQQAMELSGRRMQLETIRNNQRARAQAVQNATTQGANFGSGLQGGLAQINDQSLFNLTGINSALETGRTIGSYNSAISQDKIKMAGLGGEMSDLQGQITSLGGQSAAAGAWSSMGGSLMRSGPVIGQLAGLGGKGGSSSSGNYSGTPGASNTGGLY